MARARSTPPSRGNISQEAVSRAGQRAFGLRFLGDTVGELRRVTWPTREQVLRLTAFVLAISVAVGLFLAVVDWIFASGFLQITELLTP